MTFIITDQDTLINKLNLGLGLSDLSSSVSPYHVYTLLLLFGPKASLPGVHTVEAYDFINIPDLNVSHY